ncbi:hypothetical protein ACQI5H_02145 [Mycobacterium heidelbergense]|uniref:hypothetical protein n=1 Tax=Mycobacterium heidelbergense TaxID=53376 RepID=UPI003CF42F8D
MPSELRFDTAAALAMANRWGVSAGELEETAAPAGLGLSCQASAAAVSVAHANVSTFTAALAAQVESRATHVAAANTYYIANEADSATELAAVPPPVTGV